MPEPDEWIVVPNWKCFQHYGWARHPAWIKNYTALLRKEEYLELTLAERGLLHGIWLAYADRRGVLHRRDVHTLSRARPSVVSRTLETLRDAGLIVLSASRPLYLYLDLELQDEHARAETAAEVEKRRLRAEKWIENGVAAQIPTERLAAVIEEEFKLQDEPDVVEQLVARALQFR
jgi:hypothetical protein